MTLLTLLFLLVVNPPDVRSDQLTIGLASFLKHHGTTLSETPDPRIPNLVGTTQTFATGLNPPLDHIWIHSTSSGQVFDITLADPGLSDLTQSDAYSPLILLRILWAANSGDRQLFRAVMQASGIAVQSRAILNDEQTVLALYTALSTGQIPAISPSANGTLSAVVESARNTFTITIRPTLNLVLNGDVDLFKQKLLQSLQTPSEPTDIRLSMFHDVQDDGVSGSIELPDFGLYYSHWAFERLNRTLSLTDSAFDSLGATEAWLPAHAAFWSSISFPDSLAFAGIQHSDQYQLVLSLAMESGHQSTYSKPEALTPFFTFADVRLPSYYVVSSVKRSESSVDVEGFLMVFDPSLHYQHVFRIQDVFVGDSAERMLWTESRVHAVLVMRSEQIQDLNSAYPTGGTNMPVFQLRIR